MPADTSPRSLWTDTVFDMLLDSLRRDRPEGELKYYLKQLRARGVSAGQVLHGVGAILGEPACRRLEHFMVRKRD